MHDANRYKMATKGPSINTRTSLLKSAKAISLFFFLYICMGGIGKPFKPKTRNFHLNLNSQRVFKGGRPFDYNSQGEGNLIASLDLMLRVVVIPYGSINHCGNSRDKL